MVIIGLAVASLMGQLGASISPDAWVRSAGRLSLPAMLWAFLPGVALAWVLGHWPTMAERLARPAVAGLALVLVAYGWLGSSPSPLAGAVESAALVSGVVLLIPALIRPRPHLGSRAHRVARPFAWFGRVVSYPFYLWHNAIVFVLVGAGIGGWACAAATLVVGTLVGLASWVLVESPCLHRARTIATAANERIRPGDRASTGATVQVAPRIAS